MTQFLIEEALAIRLDGEETLAAARDAHAAALAAAVDAAKQDAKNALERGS